MRTKVRTHPGMRLQTQHLVIREPVESDWRGAHTFLSDADVMRGIHLGPEPYTESQSRRWIDDAIFHNNQHPRLSHHCIIVKRATQQAIGWIRIGQPSPHRAGIGDLDFGYALAQPEWGKGYMSEAVKALLVFAFLEMKARTLFAICESQNRGSAHVLRKAGLLHTDTFMDHDNSREDPLEMLLFTLSKEQWAVQQMI